MARHLVRPGECIHAIAARHGISAEALLAQNGELRDRRDPYVLLPGDVVEVPDRTPTRHAVGVGGSHAFRAEVPTHRLRLTVRTAGGPRADASYRFAIDGREPVTGSTDGEGVAELVVPSTARGGVLTFADDPPLVFELRFGDLNPVDDATGLQQRLQNLGHDCGEVDGRVGPRTIAALRDFQRAAGLEPSGELDDFTRDELCDRHGS